MNTTRQVDVKALVSHILRGDGIDKCRICMGDTTEGQVYLGDTVMLDGERPVTLAELLETITGVEIETTPTLPSRLCIYCVSKLLDFIPFMQLCAESNRKWSRVVELLNLPQTVNKSVHVVLSNDCEKKELLACPKITNRTIKEALRVLKLRLIRKKLYKRRADHERRMKMVHDSRLKCPECDKRFHTAFRLNKHMRNIKKKMCSRCFMVLDIEEFKTHSQMHNVRVYTCDICFACFEKKRYFLTHKLKHSRGKHVCVECKLSFSKWSKLISHLSRHKRCICSTCGKKFSNKVCYLNHAKVCAESTDLDLAKFICDYCGKEYARKATLKIHIKTIHVEGAKYQCDKCGKTFTNRSHFVEHGNTHEKVADRYVCECGVNYSSRRGYERHMKRHLMEHTDKPQVLKTKSYIEYRCVVCEETFTKLKDFKYHTRTHWSYDSSFVDEPDMEIEVVEETALPRGLCRVCSEDIITAFHIKELWKFSAQQWTAATTYFSQIYDPTDEDKSYFVFYNGGENTIVKDQVERIPNIREALERLNGKFEFDNPKPARIRRSKDLCCQCPDCGKAFTNPFYLNKHLRNSKRACNDCGLVLLKKNLSKHLSKAHNIIVYACNRCNELFDDEESLMQHWLKSHGAKKFSCEDCGRSFTNERGLSAHWYSHSLFHCKSCNQSFENRKCCKYHEKNCISEHQTTSSSFECDYCGVKYKKKPSLKIHIVQKHLNILPFVCETCGKRTSTKAHMRSHEMTHKKERKIYECYCGAKLRSELGYVLHHRIHSGEKPFTCEECGDKFLSSSRRLDHMKRKHRGSNGLPYACEKCASRFVRPCELKKHYLVVKDEVLCPPGVCVGCASTALAAQEFSIFVRNTQKMWHKAVANLSVMSTTPAPNVKSLYAFVRKSDLTIQTVKDFAGGDVKTVLNRLKNRLCKKPMDKKPRNARTGPTCSCPDCGKTFMSPYYLNMHLKNSGQKDACLLCGAVVFRGREMRDHLSAVHKEKMIICKYCPMLFSTQSKLSKHVKKAHSMGILTCSDCGRTFPRNASFDLHLQMHAVRICRACGLQFTNRACYREHRSQCEPDAKPDVQSVPRNRRSNIRDPAQFTCDHCGKTYNSRPQLKNHIIWIHMDIRPHQCQWCGKRFYTPARLAEHTVVHTRVRNFECDICGAKLVSKMAAVYHRRRHTGEKPYKCDDCGESFISASRRSEHAKRRHHVLRINCTQCPGTFVRRYDLKKHIERVHKTDEVAKRKDYVVLCKTEN